jgi:PEP-CTERM/exosortase A-associated glycosyltransferase
MKILHVLHHSAPYLDGYCVRSKQIVDFQRRAGLDVRVLTGPQHEIEVERASGVRPEPESIDGVVYHRTALPADRLSQGIRRMPITREFSMMAGLARSMRRLLAQEKIDLIHTHSPILCGAPAVRVAAEFGVPFVYEVRGFWEDGFRPGLLGGRRELRYRVSRYAETQVFRRASAVVAISRHIRDDIAARGIPPDKLHQVGNGVDTTQFAPAPKDAALLDRHGLRDRPVIGFIGSFYEFEGLECLLHAMLRVRGVLPEARLVLVGAGEQERVLPRLVRDMQLEREVVLTGRVPHAEIAGYYSVMDLLVYPRLRNRTTELTTPLKPLEALAMRKAVLGSNVGGLKEILADGKVGAMFEAGSSESLAQALISLLTNPAERERLATTGYEYALRERAWDSVVLRYRDLYHTLLTGRHASN